MTTEFGAPPSADDIAELAERAFAAIPQRLTQHVHGVGISVEELPDDETLDELGIESAWDLTGLYRGIPLTERSVSDIARQPDLIFLYRQPILLEWVETGEDLYRLVRNVLVHEIAHHFGFSDADIEALEREMEVTRGANQWPWMTARPFRHGRAVQAVPVMTVDEQRERVEPRAPIQRRTRPFFRAHAVEATQQADYPGGPALRGQVDRGKRQVPVVTIAGMLIVSAQASGAGQGRWPRRGPGASRPRGHASRPVYTEK